MISTRFNLASVQAIRSLNVNMAQLARSSERLATGFRINRAADDAAGLALVQKFRSQITGLERAHTNASMASSMLNVADEAMSTISEILIEIRDIALSAANDMHSDEVLAMKSTQISSLNDEVARIISQTRFNGLQVLGGVTNMHFQVGANAGDSLVLNIPAIDTLNGQLNTFLAGFNTAINGSASDVANLLPQMDTIVNTFAASRGVVGGMQNRLGHTMENLSNSVMHQEEALSRIRDTDIAKETMRKINADVRAQAALSVTAHANFRMNHILTLFQF